MTPIPCPNCGELIACSESGIGRKLTCPKCRVLLRLDADSGGRPVYGMARRPFGLIRLAVVVGVFLVGLGTGFLWGRRTSHAPTPSGVSATAVGFFSASNSIVVDDPPSLAPPAKPVPPMPPAPR